RYIEYDNESVITSLYRPFTKQFLYFDKLLIDRPALMPEIFPTDSSIADNRVICFSVVASERPFFTMISNHIINLNFVGFGGAGQNVPFYVYDEDGSNQRENITDWALNQFQSHYNDPSITKWDIFYYVYGLLHHPTY